MHYCSVFSIRTNQEWSVMVLVGLFTNVAGLERTDILLVVVISSCPYQEWRGILLGV